jgi:protein-S-isoprenylcysteine O-methyltransferase Ste14
MQPKIIANAWFVRLFDGWCGDVAGRLLFIASYGLLLTLALNGTVHAVLHHKPDPWFYLSMAVRVLGIINLSIPILIAIVRPPAIARLHGLLPRIVTFGGTFLPVTLAMLPSGEPSKAFVLASAAMSVIGGALTFWTWFHLGRSFSIMPEARRLATSGPYRFVRHPLYLFEEINVIGFALLFASPGAAAIVAVQIMCQLMRIENEERVLAGAFPEYRAYQTSRAKLIPGIY